MRAYKEIPEPPRFSALGHLPEWTGIDHAEGVLQRLQRYGEACGPLARVSLGPVRLLFISDATIAAEVLADPRANYKGAAYILTRAVLDNVLLLNGEAWEKGRQSYRQALKNVDVLGAARAEADRFVDRADEKIELHTGVMQMVGDVVSEFVAGAPLAPEFEAHRALIQYELAALGIDLQCRPWTYLSPLRWMRLRHATRSARKIFRTLVDARLRSPDPDRRDVMNGFISMLGDDAEKIEDGVINFFFTAHEVVASTTAWFLWLLAAHPQVQQELRDALQKNPDIDTNETLGRVSKEALRLYPGYSLFGRTTQAEMEIGGYRVPKRTFLICSPFVTHRLERYWARASEFDPSRWKDRGVGAIPPVARDGYFPFGSGARGCLASHLALPIVKTLVSRIVSRMHFEAQPGHEPALFYWGTALSKNGLPIEVRKAVRAAA